MTKSKTFAKSEIRKEILDFARDHNLVINPGRGYDYYVENYSRFGYCVCDKTRRHCPCPQAVSDVEEEGHCLCRLFWRDLETFRKIHLGKGV